MTDWRTLLVMMRVVVEPRDLWIGVSWERSGVAWRGVWWRGVRMYVCVLPMFPIRIDLLWPEDEA
jgi:hypothetical protein